ncbi:uncharacterized protein [Miscanthus floridulus]|uniref:uncharacterized protein n=1 Tax=Miscanthus floridulus TaxID=154761 RepID=UPI003459B211
MHRHLHRDLALTTHRRQMFLLEPWSQLETAAKQKNHYSADNSSHLAPLLERSRSISKQQARQHPGSSSALNMEESGGHNPQARSPGSENDSTVAEDPLADERLDAGITAAGNKTAGSASPPHPHAKRPKTNESGQ